MDSMEHFAYKQCLALLADGITDPGWLAFELYSKDMISRDLRREAELTTISVPQRNRRLLSAVEDQIITSPVSKFEVFLSILQSEPSLQHLATRLKAALQMGPTLTGYSSQDFTKACAETGSGNRQERQVTTDTGTRQNMSQQDLADMLAGPSALFGRTLGKIIPWTCPHCGESSPIGDYGGYAMEGTGFCPKCDRNIFD